MRIIDTKPSQRNQERYTRLQERLRIALIEEEGLPSIEALEARLQGDDAQTIDDLLKACGSLIYKVMFMQMESSFSLEAQYECGLKALRKLALQEFESKHKPCFLRFAAWVIRQALIQQAQNAPTK